MCDNTDKPNMLLNAETGLCTCEEGYHMHATFGCLPCAYLIPGCASCSEVYWSSGVALDSVRMRGPDSTSCSQSLTCNACQLSERFVNHSWTTDFGLYYAAINPLDLPDGLEVTTPVECEHCQTRYPGCSSCGTFG